MYLRWIPTSEVAIGDRIACLLSNASAYLTVTGWADKTIDLTRYGCGVYVHRIFTTSYAPWWVAGEDMRTFDLAREALIVGIGPSTR
jgi:hypothetical protein